MSARQHSPHLLALAALVSSSCLHTGAFPCAQTEECVADSRAGQCEPTRYCSFADGTCPSGRRYAEHASELSRQCAPAPPEGNVLANPSFEGPATPWFAPWVFLVSTGAAATLSIDSETSASGDTSARIEVSQSTPATWWNINLAQWDTVLLEEGGTYDIVFWAKASDARPINTSVHNSTNDTLPARFEAVIDLTTSWQRFERSFSAGLTEPAYLNFTLAHATGQVWLDDVSISRRQ